MSKPTIQPLVFRRNHIGWDELRAGLQDSASGFEAVQVFDDLESEERRSTEVGTFPVPGAMEGSTLTGLEVGPTGVTFPGPGAYYLLTRRGVFKVLILADGPDIDEIVAIASFVSANHFHSHADHWQTAPYRQSQPIDLFPLHVKLFHSDQPLGLHCTHIAALLVFELVLCGHQARRVWVNNPQQNAGHIVAEAFSVSLNQWVMLDPDYGAIVADRSDRLMSVEAIIACREDRDSLRVLDIGNKRRPKAAPQVSPHFMGYMSWRPDHMTADPALTPERYLGFVIPERFIEASYADILIEEEPTRAFPTVSFIDRGAT